MTPAVSILSFNTKGIPSKARLLPPAARVSSAAAAAASTLSGSMLIKAFSPLSACCRASKAWANSTALAWPEFSSATASATVS